MIRFHEKNIKEDFYFDVFNKIETSLNAFSYGIKDACYSSILGGDGNTEFLILITKNPPKFDVEKFLTVRG